MRTLFILKKNETYGFQSYTRRSSGLWNSTRYINECFVNNGIYSCIVEVIDNNCIDREITRFCEREPSGKPKPMIVVIEALWVVPEKFDILKKLHPNVRWFIHLHSHIPFLALEGNALDWINRCGEKGVGMIANSWASYRALKGIYKHPGLVFLPNIYILPDEFKDPPEFNMFGEKYLHVGCFGAIRPLKNQLLQAMAAIKYAKKMGKDLKFYVNSSRVETGGNPVLKNLRSLLGNSLVELPWMENDQFIDLCRHMDIGLQVSLTETFNVVTADMVHAGIPVVVSKEVTWASRWSKAKDDSIDSIVKSMERAIRFPVLIWVNRWFLEFYSRRSQLLWLKWNSEQKISVKKT